MLGGTKYISRSDLRACRSTHCLVVVAKVKNVFSSVLPISATPMSMSKSFNDVTSSGDRILRTWLRGSELLELKLPCLEQDGNVLNKHDVFTDTSVSCMHALLMEEFQQHRTCKQLYV